jgi:prephenate dehydratase
MGARFLRYPKPVARYTYLGPAGTFTEAALTPLLKPTDSSTPAVNVTAALDAVRTGIADKALVPIENSVEGVVARTLDELAVGEKLLITAERTINVVFDLFSGPKTDLSNIKTLATHPHAEAQCRNYIAKNYPQIEIIATPSTAFAAKGLQEGQWDLAIASASAQEQYGLTKVAANVGDNPSAQTRFVLVEKTDQCPPPTGFDRTSMAVFIDQDHAGALLEILTAFAAQEVNLTFIQSRPTGKELGHYHFIIDVEGHITDTGVANSLKALNEICDEVRFLGSYPRVV